MDDTELGEATFEAYARGEGPGQPTTGKLARLSQKYAGEIGRLGKENLDLQIALRGERERASQLADALTNLVEAVDPWIQTVGESRAFRQAEAVLASRYPDQADDEGGAASSGRLAWNEAVEKSAPVVSSIQPEATK